MKEVVTDAVSILLDATMIHRRQIILDNMHHTSNIQSTASNTSRNHDRHVTLAESTDSTLTLALRTLRVDGSNWKILVEEVVIELITDAAGVDEDQSTACWDGAHKIDKGLALLAPFDPDGVLLNVGVGGTGATDGDTAMVVAHVCVGNLTSGWREGGGKHKHADIAFVLGWKEKKLATTTPATTEISAPYYRRR